MVHAKVMIVDDRLLRIGSANLNNRSMGTDSECDLALEAANAEDRAAISRLLHRLLAEHPGRDSEEIAAMLAQEGSLLGLVARSEEHPSELQSLMRISYAVFCLKKTTNATTIHHRQ